MKFLDKVPNYNFLLPDGEYTGKLGGYNIDVDGNDFVKIAIPNGVRGINIPVKIIVSGEEANIYLIEKSDILK